MARHFTKDEIEEIRVQLATKAVRDSELPAAETVYDEDEMAIVQAGHNKRLSVTTLEEHIREPFASDEETRQRNERTRQENEATRQENENGEHGRVANERVRQQNEATRQQGEQNRNTAYATAEGTKSGSTAGDGSRWGEYKTAEAARDTARQTAEGTSSSTAGDGTRWGAYKTAEAARDTARENAEGTSSSTAGDGTRWGAYKTSEAARDTASADQEGTSSSTVGDGTRWGTFLDNEEARDALVDEKVSDITNLQSEVSQLGQQIYAIIGGTKTEADLPSTASSYWKNNEGVVGYAASGMGLRRVSAIGVVAGQKINIKTTLGSATVDGGYVCDNSGNILQTISKAQATSSAGATITVAANGTKLYLNYLSTLTVVFIGKQDKLTFDSTPTKNSTNPVTSGGVFNSIESIKEFQEKYTAQKIEDNTTPLSLSESDFESGSINSTDGSSISSDNCIRSIELIPVVPGISVSCTTSNSYRWTIHEYDADGNYIVTAVTWRTGVNSVILNARTAFIRFVIASPSGVSTAPVWVDAAFSCTPAKIFLYKRAFAEEDGAAIEVQVAEANDAIKDINGFTVTQTENPGTSSSYWKNNNGVIGYADSGLGLHRADAIDVAAGRSYNLTTGIGSASGIARAYFCDDSGNIVYEVNLDSVSGGAVPVGATKLYINYLSSYSFTLVAKYQEALTYDERITENSDNNIKSGTVASQISKPLEVIGRQVCGGPVPISINERYKAWAGISSLFKENNPNYFALNPISIAEGQIVKIIGNSNKVTFYLANDTTPISNLASSVDFCVIAGVNKMYLNVHKDDYTKISVMIQDACPDSVKKYLATKSGAGFNFVLDDTMFSSGNINSNTGLGTTDNNLINSKFFDIYPGSNFTVSTQNSYRLGLAFYDENHALIRVNEWYTSQTTISAPANAYYVRFIIAFPSGQSSVIPTVADAQPSVYTDASIEYIRAGVSEDEGGLELPICAPSPQLPADGSANSDFNAETLKPAEIWSAFDGLVASIPGPDSDWHDYPKFMTRYSVVGRDASNTFDIYAYILGVRNRYAWKYADKLFAFKNGSTVVYLDSVSPLAGMTIYSDANRTDSGKTVVSFDAANQQFTASDSVVYTKSVEDNVDTDVLYSKSPQSKSTLNNLTLYNKSDVSQGDATAVDLTHLTLNSKTYTRCEDLDYDINSKGTILIWGNEHGPQSDPAEPAIILYRFAKDILGGCRGNAFISYLKKNYKIVLIPCLNPYGMYNHTRNNANSVNINRNYPTPGWAVVADTDKGTYAGDQPETQFAINAIAALEADLVIDIHCLGYVAVGGGGRTHYEGYIPNQAFLQRLVNTMEEYSFNCSSYGDGDYTQGSQGADWIHYQDLAGGLLEMNAGPYASPGGDGKQHQPHYMEADYTLLLASIRMWLAGIYPTLDLSKIGIV